MLSYDVITDDKDDITLNILDNNIVKLFVECYLVSEDDNDTYAVRIYDRYDELAYNLIDSDGGSYSDWRIKTNDVLFARIIIDYVEQILFDNDNGLVTKHWKSN